jgi:phage terminase large subunit-like protein
MTRSHRPYPDPLGRQGTRLLPRPLTAEPAPGRLVNDIHSQLNPVVSFRLRRSERSDEIGIVVAGLGSDGKGYVLADRSARLGPAQWGRLAVTAYHAFRADRIVAERNFGGAMVENVIKTAGPNVPVKTITASRGKAVRAEPIAAFYAQGKVCHVGRFPQLEEQMLNMSSAGYVGAKSPTGSTRWCGRSPS